ncbi:MAG: light-harvesting protein [Alphaproteobacteria bacterium]|nr:light-harvesting protein [Alphaproteobacteria bacterium]
MVNGKMWLVVKPTVGIPLFFLGIVVASLSVHTALLLNTSYFPAFLRGAAPARTSEATPPALAAPAAVRVADVKAKLQ